MLRGDNRRVSRPSRHVQCCHSHHRELTRGAQNGIRGRCWRDGNGKTQIRQFQSSHLPTPRCHQPSDTRQLRETKTRFKCIELYAVFQPLTAGLTMRMSALSTSEFSDLISSLIGHLLSAVRHWRTTTSRLRRLQPHGLRRPIRRPELLAPARRAFASYWAHARRAFASYWAPVRRAFAWVAYPFDAPPIASCAPR